VESLTSVFVVLCPMIPNGHYSSELNFNACICDKAVHTLIVLSNGQIKVLTYTVCINRYVLSLMIYVYTHIHIYIYPYTYADMYNVSAK
jgi:hypothetical protein